MKMNIHPTYYSDARVVCNCGNTFTTGSTKQEIRIEVCSACHPVYTRVKRYVDTLGRVDKFILAQNVAAQKQALRSSKKKSRSDSSDLSRAPRTIKEMLEMLEAPSKSQ